MNIYMYLSEPALNLNVPDRCKPLWNEIIALSKINNMSQIEQIQYLQKYHALLTDESSLDLEKIEKWQKRGESQSLAKHFLERRIQRSLFVFVYLLGLCRAALSVCDRTLDRREGAVYDRSIQLRHACESDLCLFDL